MSIEKKDLNKNFISHCEINDLLCLTMLVYNYGKTFEFGKNQDVESFMNQIKNEPDKLDTLGLNQTRKEAFLHLCSGAPHGKILKFISNDDTDIQVGITKSEVQKRINVVFRGSESKSDWWYDLQIFKKELENNICVHVGFYKQLFSVYAELEEYVLKNIENNPDYEVYITGHSLGAALATLFGYLLSTKTNRKITIVSFASPRVGNKEWKNNFESKENLIHYRVTNNRDIVTALPMWDYHHVGINVQLFEDCYKVHYNESYNKFWEYSIFRCFNPWDHDCDLYYKNLLKNVW